MLINNADDWIIGSLNFTPSNAWKQFVQTKTKN